MLNSDKSYAEKQLSAHAIAEKVAKSQDKEARSTSVAALKEKLRKDRLTTFGKAVLAEQTRRKTDKALKDSKQRKLSKDALTKAKRIASDAKRDKYEKDKAALQAKRKSAQAYGTAINILKTGEEQRLAKADAKHQRSETALQTAYGIVTRGENSKPKTVVQNHNVDRRYRQYVEDYNLVLALAYLHLKSHCSLKDLHSLVKDESKSAFEQSVLTQAVKAAESIHYKSGTNTHTVGNTGWFSEERLAFLEDLTANSVYAALIQNGAVEIVTDRYQSISLPRRSSTKSVSGGFIEEGGTLPVKSDSLGSIALTPHKLAVIISITSDLVKSTSLDVLELLKTAIGDDTVAAIDTNLLSSNAAVSGVRPPGLLHGATNKQSVDIETDVKWLLATLITGTGSDLRNPVVIMNPANHLMLKMTFDAFGRPMYPEAHDENNPRLLNMGIITSTNVRVDTVIACEPNDIAFLQSDELPEYTLGRDAVLVMADDNSTAEPAMTATGAVTVGGSIKVSDADNQPTSFAKVASVYQQDNIALRMVHQLTWGQLRSGSVCYVSRVNW